MSQPIILRSDAVWSSRLRERRRELSLTQQDLADLADVGVRLVHEVEHGSQAVQLENLLRLLHALGLHLELAPGAVRARD